MVYSAVHASGFLKRKNKVWAFIDKRKKKKKKKKKRAVLLLFAGPPWLDVQQSFFAPIECSCNFSYRKD